MVSHCGILLERQVIGGKHSVGGTKRGLDPSFGLVEFSWEIGLERKRKGFGLKFGPG